MKPNLKRFALGAKTVLSKNSPQILLALGIVGTGVSIVTAVHATPKALELIEERKAELDTDKLTPVETVKTTWKCYLPAALSFGASAACLLTSNSITAKRTAALATAYNLSTMALNEYKNAVVETVGEKKINEIRSKVAEKKVESMPKENSTVIVTGNGDTACYDSLSGRVFMSSIDKIDKAVNVLNRNIIDDLYASLNDFYDILGLEDIELGELLGWHIDDGKIEIEYDAVLHDGKPCIVLNYNVAPRYEYYKICR